MPNYVCIKSKDNSAVLLKLLFYHTETINKCVWLQMARMEMDSNLKMSGKFFQDLKFYWVSDKIGKT